MCGICFIRRGINIHQHRFSFNFFEDYLINDYLTKQQIYQLTKIPLNQHVIKQNLILPQIDLKQISIIKRRGPDAYKCFLRNELNVVKIPQEDINKLSTGETLYCQSILSLRANSKQDNLDMKKGILLYNGQIYLSKQTLCPQPFQSDTKWLHHQLNSIPDQQLEKGPEALIKFLNQVRGDFVFIYQRGDKIFIGKDIFGKKSLLIGFQSDGLILTSQAIGQNFMKEIKPQGEEQQQQVNDWAKKYKAQWMSSAYKYYFQIPKNVLITITKTKQCIYLWQKSYIRPNIFLTKAINNQLQQTNQIISKLKNILLESITELVSNIASYEAFFHIKQQQLPKIEKLEGITNGYLAILFSGGLDSTLIARLLDLVLPKSQQIDLINIVFQQNAPDRITAIKAYEQLKSISPTRKYNLILINKTVEDIYNLSGSHLKVIYPKNTHMDFNISVILHTACTLKGIQYQSQKKELKSNAKIIFSGLGADQIFAGYSRYRVAFNRGGYSEMEREMNFDLQRLWIRNLGRDDRSTSCQGKQVRYPFLYQPLIQYIKNMVKFELLTDFKLPKGEGDKVLLRKVAQQFGLKLTMTFKKTAIQFGTRLAKQSNIKMFGSNRKAKGTYKFQKK